MRKLRIVGVDTESSLVECEVPDSGEKFSLPLDDRFRAAARGEYIAAGGADREPVTGTLRPREIQDRIRHGASPEEVASDAGVPLSRIEGFAIPVLLERSNAADLARDAHPVLSDGPSLDTLADKVDAALDHRGIDPDLVKWDAWRDRSGGWVVTISWPAGLSDDARATWSFEPDSHGGSARALDEEAERILDPSRATALRTVASPPPLPSGPPPVRSVPPLDAALPDRSGAPVHGPETTDAPDPPGRTPVAAVPLTAPGDRHDVGRSGSPAAAPPAAPSPGGPAAVPSAAVTPPDAADERGDTHRPAASDADESGAGRSGAHADGRPAGRVADQPGAQGRAAPAAPGASAGARASKSDESDDDEDFLQHTPTEPERRPSSRRHPTMPSWEDVLLGVRSKDD